MPPDISQRDSDSILVSNIEKIHKRQGLWPFGAEKELGTLKSGFGRRDPVVFTGIFG